MSVLDSIPLKKKLTLAFGVVIFLLIITSLFSVSRVTSIGGALRAQQDVANNKLAALYVAREALDQTGIAARNAYIYANDADAARELDRIDAQKAIYLEQLAKLDKEFSTDRLYVEIRSEMHSMAEELERPRKYREAKQMVEYARFLEDECSPLRRRIVANIASLLAAVENQNAIASDLALEHERSAVLWIGAVTAATLIFALAVAITISRSLFRQLGGDPARAVEAAVSIAQGDLKRTVDADKAHPGSLVAAMGQMHQNLHNIVSNVRLGSENINVASSEIAAGNLDLSTRTEAQAAALENVTSQIKTLVTSVSQNATDADSACAIAAKATAVSEEGGRVVTKVVQTMAEINDSSKNIAEIVGVIDSIAFQTNILALNAAVEAARAGEQGKGFAVVAAEVRNLAQRSAAAAKDVKALISSSVQKVGDGMALVEEAGSTMSSVVVEIQRVSGLISQISTAATEQYAGIAKIDSAVSKLDGMTQQNAALVEEAAAAAQALQQQAAELADTVRVFKI